MDVETRDISLAGRIIAQFPDRLTDEQRIDDALAELGDAGQDSRGQHHQAAEHQRLDPAAEGRDQGAPGAGLRPAGLPRRAEDRRGARGPRPLRQGQGQRGQPGPARGQLRPPRAGVGEELRPQAPALDGRVERRLEDQRRAHDRRRLPLQREVRGRRLRGLAADRAGRRQRRDHRAQGVGSGHGGRGRRRDRHAGRRAARVPDRADRPGQGRGRAVLGAPQGHDDEGLRPDHLRPRGARLLPEVFAQYGEVLAKAGLSPNDGLGGILAGIESLPEGPEIKKAIEQGIADGPELAMVDSDKGITNLHVPSDVIVDASMPAMIRTSGHMWGPDGNEADTLAVIPDSSYAGIYQVVIDDCRANGAFDPVTMGSVPNVGLMAQCRRGVRLPRQDVRDPDHRHRARRRRGGRRTPGARGVRGRHLADVPDQGRPDPRLGQARRLPRPRHRGPRGVLARRGPRARRQADRQGAASTSPSTTPTGSRSRS